MFSSDFQNVKECSRLIKEFNKKIVIIIGGPHPSSTPVEALTYLKDVDYGFKGEAEIGLSTLLKNLSSKNLKNVPGLIYRKGKKIECNRQMLLEDLDSLGFPSWDLINPLWYQKGLQTLFVKNLPVAPIMTTRGCPYQCTYCSAREINGIKIRYRSASKIVDEIELLQKQYGIKEIWIEDDNFTFNKNFVKEFCNELIKRNVKISWSCPNGVRLNTLDRELLDLMKKTGCYILMVGIEFGSQRILDKVKKSLRVEEIREKVKLINESGIDAHGFFIMGFPTEAKEDIMKTIKLALELDLVGANFAFFHPLPGTEIFRELVKNKEVNEENYEGLRGDKATYADILYTPKGLSYDELKKYHHYAVTRFYLRPKIILKYLREIKSLRNLGYLMRRAFSYLT